MGSFSIKTELDAELDIMFIYPVGHLEDEADCKAMHDGWVALHATQLPDSYSVAVMDMFSVAPQAKELYLAYVSRISSHNRGVCVVVNFSALDSRAVANNLDTFNVDVFFASSIEDGVALLQRVRTDRAMATRKTRRETVITNNNIEVATVSATTRR